MWVWRSKYINILGSSMGVHSPTDNKTFIVGIMTVKQCSYDCCLRAFISTWSKYLSDGLYHNTNYDFFYRLPLVAISILSLPANMSLVTATTDLYYL